MEPEVVLVLVPEDSEVTAVEPEALEAMAEAPEDLAGSEVMVVEADAVVDLEDTEEVMPKLQLLLMRMHLHLDMQTQLHLHLPLLKHSKLNRIK